MLEGMSHIDSRWNAQATHNIIESLYSAIKGNNQVNELSIVCDHAKNLSVFLIEHSETRKEKINAIANNIYISLQTLDLGKCKSLKNWLIQHKSAKNEYLVFYNLITTTQVFEKIPSDDVLDIKNEDTDGFESIELDSLESVERDELEISKKIPSLGTENFSEEKRKTEGENKTEGCQIF